MYSNGGILSTTRRFKYNNYSNATSAHLIQALDLIWFNEAPFFIFSEKLAPNVYGYPSGGKCLIALRTYSGNLRLTHGLYPGNGKGAGPQFNELLSLSL